MNWFLIALIGPLLFAITNHTDKYLLSRYVQGGRVGSLLIFSALFSLFAVPIVFLIHPDVFGVNLFASILLAVNGMLTVIALLCYLYALNSDEASFVVPFYQTIPVFGFVLGYFLLGETVTPFQGLASLLIVIGATILSFEIGKKKFRFKRKVVILMLFASFLYAINSVIFKMVALDDGFWPSTFWGLVGKVVLGLAFLLFVASYRKQFLKLLGKNRTPILGINAANETLSIVGEGVTQYATLLAPVVLVLLVSSLQPVFVLLLGIMMALFLPWISRESLDRTQIFQKIAGIGLIVAGSCFIGIV